MKQTVVKHDKAWRKSRLAARLLIRKESRPLGPREQALAHQLSQDPEVTNRLIEQALYFLGIGPRKRDFDQNLMGGRVFSRHWKIKHGAF
ncbi:MAG TPA: hypothetical protein VK815_18570 [Candidatus Acidoferrales bacterium]|jgi:hypothetical protein|nr:hypothetical protein [Candidatus Acidoferrales bacterium]